MTFDEFIKAQELDIWEREQCFVFLFVYRQFRMYPEAVTSAIAAAVIDAKKKRKP